MNFEDYCNKVGLFATSAFRDMWDAATKAEREACAAEADTLRASVIATSAAMRELIEQRDELLAQVERLTNEEDGISIEEIFVANEAITNAKGES